MGRICGGYKLAKSASPVLFSFYTFGLFDGLSGEMSVTPLKFICKLVFSTNEIEMNTKVFFSSNSIRSTNHYMPK